MTVTQKRKRAREKYYEKLGRKVPPLNRKLSAAIRERRANEAAMAKIRARNGKGPPEKPTRRIKPHQERDVFVSDARIYIDNVLRCLGENDLEGVMVHATMTKRALHGKV